MEMIQQFQNTTQIIILNKTNHNINHQPKGAIRYHMKQTLHQSISEILLLSTRKKLCCMKSRCLQSDRNHNN